LSAVASKGREGRPSPLTSRATVGKPSNPTSSSSRRWRREVPVFGCLREADRALPFLCGRPPGRLAQRTVEMQARMPQLVERMALCRAVAIGTAAGKAMTRGFPGHLHDTPSRGLSRDVPAPQGAKLAPRPLPRRTVSHTGSHASADR